MIKTFTKLSWPTDRWPNFSFKEMACRETGQCMLDEKLMDALQALRAQCGFSLTVTSGYRSPEHSVERSKTRRGAHTYGVAVDIQVSGERAYRVVREALALGFSGVGIKQSGEYEQRFIHLDRMSRTVADDFPRPMLWSYS